MEFIKLPVQGEECLSVGKKWTGSCCGGGEGGGGERTTALQVRMATAASGVIFLNPPPPTPQPSPSPLPRASGYTYFSVGI